MTRFATFVTNFQLHPKAGDAAWHLEPTVTTLGRIDFEIRVNNPTVNLGQLHSDFEGKLENLVRGGGSRQTNLGLPAGAPQESDCAFAFHWCRVAVGIGVENSESILCDPLESHIYLRTGADFALIAMPLRNSGRDFFY